ncbi:MAG: shikimate dehydrogenase [Parvibaculum sp.]
MTRRVCIIGWPAGHSRSPLIHNHWIAKYGIADAVYERLAIAPENLARQLDRLADTYIGANVTVPHKEAVFACLKQHDAIAKRLGAVNTLVKTADGFEGRNTDGYGFIENLKDRHPAWQASAGPALILGAGGAARAIALALEQAGCPELRLVNRAKVRAERLIGELALCRATALGWDEMEPAMVSSALLVNTTTLGMTGEAELTIDLSFLPRHALVTDIVYTPIQTGLLRAAALSGLATVDGLGMLLYQAVPGFEAWFGIRPDVTQELRDLVIADLKAPLS